MARFLASSWLHILGPCFCLALTACATQLAPSYSPKIVSELEEYNSALATHFAAAEGGTKKGLSEEEAATYDKLIGDGKALLILLNSRPTPSSRVLERIATRLPERLFPEAAQDGEERAELLLDPPTDDLIRDLLEQLVTMKDEDLRQGFKQGQSALYENAVSQYLTAALFYENFLNRGGKDE